MSKNQFNAIYLLVWAAISLIFKFHSDGIFEVLFILLYVACVIFSLVAQCKANEEDK